jgi:hypothetical protein
VTHAWHECDRYAVTAQVVDEENIFSEWSAPETVNISYLRWRYEVGDYCVTSAAVSADGTVYVGSHDCFLYSFYGGSPLAGSAWPRFHHDARNTGRVGGGH